MLFDHSLPRGLAPPERVVRRHGSTWCSAVWTPSTLAALAGSLSASDYGGVPGDRLSDAWAGAVTEMLDPGSPVRLGLERPLRTLTGLSPPGLHAGLDTILTGAKGDAALELLRRATPPPDRSGRRLTVLILAGTPPALVVQPLLPALAARCPVLIKSASDEPLFAPALVEGLCRREPSLRSSIAATTWPGGDRELEPPVLARATTVIAYGGEETMHDLELRAGPKLIAFGPKLSLALIGADVDPRDVAGGLSSDVALFDQRGCLSIQAVYTGGDARALADALASALAERARAWPMGEIPPRQMAGVRQVRGVAAMRGLYQPALDLRQGTVVVEESPQLQPAPGLRTVRIHPVAHLADAVSHLAPWRGRLQGAALAGDDAWAVEPRLRALGISRCTPPGELQRTGADWHNGGIRLDAIL